MNIVGPPTAYQPSYYYPKTMLTAWLCETVTDTISNNSESQAEIYYQQFSSTSQFANNQYAIYAVTGCPKNPEDVNDGSVVYSPAQPDGFHAIVYDMSDQNNPNKCQKNSGH